MQGKLQISTETYLFLPAAILLLPLRWLLAWVLASGLHELGHYIALRLCKIPIFALQLSPFGAKMEVGEMQSREAVLCALAGPIFAFLFTVFSPVLPCTAVCILFQSLYNLLPIYPLDGGRALREILCRLLPNAWVSRIETGMLVLIAATFLRLIYILHLGKLPALLILLFFVQKFLANWGNSRYNREKNLF